MRHRKSGIKLSRTSSHRDAMFRNMVTSLFKYERIKTTDVKAKELRRLADEMITLAKRGDLHAQRQAHAVIREKSVVYKLFNDVAKRFDQIQGGYTRSAKIGLRAGDAAPMTLIELSVLGEHRDSKKSKKKKDKSASQVQPTVTPKETKALDGGKDQKEEQQAPADSNESVVNQSIESGSEGKA